MHDEKSEELGEEQSKTPPPPLATPLSKDILDSGYVLFLLIISNSPAE